MPFIVPKFIERKAKIVGPFTFKQFLLVGGAGAGCVALYFLLSSFFLFLTVSFILISASLVLALVKINGKPVPLLVKDFFEFLFSSKIYLWKKKKTSPSLIRKKEEMEEKEEKEIPALNISEKSRLKNLSSKIESGQR